MNKDTKKLPGSTKAHQLFAVVLLIIACAAATAAQTETVWVEDAVPAGANTPTSVDGWNFVTSNPTPYSGTAAHKSALASGVHNHYFQDATATLTIGTGDKLFAYVYLDPSNPPTEVMLQWKSAPGNVLWDDAYWGADNMTDSWAANRRYMGPLPTTGQWVRLEVPASFVGLEGKTLNGMAFTLYGGQATWDRAGKVNSPPDAVWVEDAIPAGANTPTSVDGWNFVTSNPTPYSGANAHKSVLASGVHNHYFQDATATLTVGVGDKLFAYVYLDPSNPPTEVMMQWKSAPGNVLWDDAYWGADNMTDSWAANRHYMGPLPPLGQWVRLEVPASVVNLEGKTLNGMAFTLYGGQATWDRAGKVVALPETVWVEDAIPAGANTPTSVDGWNFVTSNPTPYSGTTAHQSALASGVHNHYFQDATATLSVAAGDKLFAYVYLDPSNPPTEVMLQWKSAPGNVLWDDAYWGADNMTDSWAANRHYIGSLPELGKWVRLEVPASVVNLEGKTLNGMAFTLYGGRATWDHAGKVVNAPLFGGAWQKFGAPGDPPVLPVGSATWESQWLALKSVVRNENDPGCNCVRYYGYYHAQPGDNLFQIGLATSDDGGVNWTKHVGPIFTPSPNPVPSPSPSPAGWEQYAVANPIVWKESATWYMLYSGRPTREGASHMGLATSTDGITFSRSGDVMTGECGWDNFTVGPASVIKVGSTYRVYYTGINNYTAVQNSDFTQFKIGYATSTDLIHWSEKDNGVCRPPVLSGVLHAWDEGVLEPFVQKFGDLYYMWYQGNTDPGTNHSAIGLAVSLDGINWTRSSGNPVLSRRDPQSFWDGMWTESPVLVKVGPTQWRLFYSGSNAGVPTMQTGFATWTPQ
jgi:predicted GH43/DUF377 family glycosyl hydrolase